MQLVFHLKVLMELFFQLLMELMMNPMQVVLDLIEYFSQVLRLLMVYFQYLLLTIDDQDVVQESKK
jgi:hypothetical protein